MDTTNKGNEMNGMKLMRHTKNGKLYLIGSAAVVGGKVAAIDAAKPRGWVYVNASLLKAKEE